MDNFTSGQRRSQKDPVQLIEIGSRQLDLHRGATSASRWKDAAGGRNVADGQAIVRGFGASLSKSHQPQNILTCFSESIDQARAAPAPQIET